MENLLSQASISIRQLQQDLAAYENAVDRQTDGQTYQIVTDRIQNLIEQCDRLDILVNKEPAQSRAQSRQRVNEIKYDLVHYQVCLCCFVLSLIRLFLFRLPFQIFKIENNNVKKLNDNVNYFFIENLRRIVLKRMVEQHRSLSIIH